MSSSNPKSTSSQIISPAFCNHARASPLVDPGHPHIPCPPLSVVKFLKSMCVATPTTGTFVALRAHFLMDSYYAAFGKHGQAFLPNIFTRVGGDLSERDTGEFALANLRHHRCASCESERSVTDLFAIQFDAALIDHAHRFGGAWRQTGLLQ